MDTTNMTVMSDTRSLTASPAKREGIDTDRTLAMRTWERYSYARDNGHQRFVERADMCSDFFRGHQWRDEDVQELQAANRPHLTINKIKPTILTQLGEQVQNRADISFRPKDGANPQTAETLTKLFKHISEINQLDWKRSDMFADGMITSRGYLDIRMNWDNSLTGDVEFTHLNPKNVIPDPDATHSDPDTWNEVFVTKWVTIDDIELLYGVEKADAIRGSEGGSLPFGYDAIDRIRDRFGERFAYAYGTPYVEANAERNIRLIERQHRMLSVVRHLVDLKTGDMRPVPGAWSAQRVQQVAKEYGLGTTKKTIKRVKWDVIAGGEVMHSDWSPYKHFTIVPFFPVFMHGHTLGAVEDLIDPQELLNKSLSQELHIINSTANGGWKIKTGNLRNMSVEELEQKGAQTGIVLELDEMDGAEKITANTTPQGLDRLSFKAEEHMKGISNVSDSMQGQDREDVSGKAIQQKRQAGAASHAKPLDSLVRTDFIIARNVIDLIQEYYTEERVITITHDKVMGTTEALPINQVQPDGTVSNDLSIGTYEVVISSVPLRETLEDSQFDQAVAMREMGVAIDDSVIINSSRLLNKGEILKAMEAKANSPEAQAQAALVKRAQEADIGLTEAETQVKLADVGVKGAKTQKDAVLAQKEAITPVDAGNAGPDPLLERQKADDEYALAHDKQEHDKEMDRQKLDLEREKASNDQALAQKKAEDDAVAKRVALAHQRTASVGKPAAKTAVKPKAKP